MHKKDCTTQNQLSHKNKTHVHKTCEKRILSDYNHVVYLIEKKKIVNFSQIVIQLNYEDYFAALKLHLFQNLYLPIFSFFKFIRIINLVFSFN